MDFNKAFYWYKKAADAGLASSQFNLGLMYVKGQGVAKDLTKAKELFRQACENGLPNGCEAYKDMENRGY